MNSITRNKASALLFSAIALVSQVVSFNFGRIHELRAERARVAAREGQFLAAWQACAPAVYVDSADPVQAAVQDRVPGLRVCAFLQTGEYGLFEWHIENYGTPQAKMVHTWAPVGRWRP